ncbi:MAG: metallophosphoesterase family protein [Firmicutes bacterium]|nr:metallophosphoesterase family protein [Bacillota bacterium]
MRQVEYRLKSGLIGLVADTHVPTRATALPAQLFTLFRGVDLILHAGDLVVASILNELGALAPVEAVAGNMDPAGLKAKLGLKKIICLGEVSLGLIHGTGLPRGKPAPILQCFQGCNIQGLIFGHSHVPLWGYTAGILTINPGSATDPRAGNRPSCALLRVEGRQLQGEILELS